MTTRISMALLALAVASVPASAQISTTDRVRDRVILGGDRTGSRSTGGVGDIILGRTDSRTTDARVDRVPRGHLPPRGRCRVWVDGVPPGHQAPVTSCADAERNRVHYGSNAFVIYGDQVDGRSKGKGKYRKGDRDREDTILGRRADNDDARVQRRIAAAKASKSRGKSNR